MRIARNMSSAVALYAIVAASLMPASSFAGVISITDKASLSRSLSLYQVDLRAYPHRHHRWHTGSYNGCPQYRYSMYPGRNPGNVADGSAYPAYTGATGEGFYGNVCQSCRGWNFGY